MSVIVACALAACAGNADGTDETMAAGGSAGSAAQACVDKPPPLVRCDVDPGAKDADGDGLRNCEDDDMDGDGLANADDCAPLYTRWRRFRPATGKTWPKKTTTWTACAIARTPTSTATACRTRTTACPTIEGVLPDDPIAA